MIISRKLILILFACLFYGLSFAQVSIWEEDIVLPSYRLTAPDVNPMFYKGESYQGAQKRVYPYPLIDGITGEKQEESFRALFLENDYIKLCVLPEIGGRLFYATDKTNGYNFFYKQSVIKPALIGMLGAWISGGIEWCVFHHHRNTTHMPIDYSLSENSDGSKTIWIGETERRHRMRWIIGISLHPGRSFIEVKVKMINRTELPHSILYWANVAVHVNDNYQIIFPPSVQVATYHAKNDFVNWPIGQGMYQRSDYTNVDLSWWKNHPHQVSCFAWDLRDNFMGGYDFGQNAGVVHVANHHIVRGAKLWEWAPGNIWDTKVLTDSDGPYAELMVGAFSDNQPDYSWIKPYEVKEFSQYWYPVKKLGGFKNANRDAAVNLELEKSYVHLGVQTTSILKNARVVLFAREQKILDKKVDISPNDPFLDRIKIGKDIKKTELLVQLENSEGKVIIEYQPIELEPIKELPEPVKAPPIPEDITTIEELYLTGKRVQQIYKPSIDATSYFREAIKRDSNDVRCNTEMGIHCYKNALYEEAEEYLGRALERMTIDYTRPEDTASMYYLGLVQKAKNHLDKAYDLFYKATWDYEYYSSGYFQLATISCRQGHLETALNEIDLSLSTNVQNTKAINIKTAILRQMDYYKQAADLCEHVLLSDPLDFFAMNEKYLLDKASEENASAQNSLALLNNKMRGDVQSYLELATDYMSIGCYQEAVDLLQRFTQSEKTGSLSPLVYYYLAYLSQELGDLKTAKEYVQQASTIDFSYCFPFRHETIDVLNNTLELVPSDSRALYYLGNLYYDLQPEKAITLWEQSCQLDPTCAIVFRNLGWGYFRFHNDINDAIASYEKAIEKNPNDPRYYLELDDLYDRANIEPLRRLDMFDNNRDIISKRKDVLIRFIDLSVKSGKYDQAISQLLNNKFFISEGGGAELGNAYVDAFVLRGLSFLNKNLADSAYECFQAATIYPENLSQESLRNERKMPLVNYYIGKALVAMGKKNRAIKQFRDITESEFSSRQNESMFYKALALIELGKQEQAKEIGQELFSTATRRIEGQGDIDFFAKFGEQRSNQSQIAEAHYILGLGLLLQGDRKQAQKEFDSALEYNKGHTWAKYQLSILNDLGDE